MTEEEAKTKVCCGPPGVTQAMILTSDRFTLLGGGETIGKCIGSACMAWRETAPAVTYYGGTERTQRGGETPPEKMRELGWVEVARHLNGHGPAADQFRDVIEWFRPAEGLCGLAGAPQ